MATLIDLIESGLISPDSELIWKKAGSPVTYRAKIVSDGRIVTDDGVIHESLSTAACHVNGGVSTNGWRVWRDAVTLKKLDEIRTTYLKIENGESVS